MRRVALILLSALLMVLVASPSAFGAKNQRLGYAKAKRAIQAKADKFAGERTSITAMFRLGDTIYSARAEWDRVNPIGCTGCGYDPVTGSIFDEPRTESCSVSLEAKLLRSGRIRVSTETFACY